jgi:HptB-dependent secretion and biofilm anti anti-sigma factor
MGINAKIQDCVARITITGRFDFQLNRGFKGAFAPLIEDAAVREIEVELSMVDYLDSSALGMLMLLNRQANGSNKSLTLLDPSGVASNVLEVANFSRIFKIIHGCTGTEPFAAVNA